MWRVPVQDWRTFAGWWSSTAAGWRRKARARTKAPRSGSGFLIRPTPSAARAEKSPYPFGGEVNGKLGKVDEVTRYLKPVGADSAPRLRPKSANGFTGIGG